MDYSGTVKNLLLGQFIISLSHWTPNFRVAVDPSSINITSKFKNEILMLPHRTQVSEA